MATTKQVILTTEGLAKLEAELEDLKTVKRRECVGAATSEGYSLFSYWYRISALRGSL